MQNDDSSKYQWFVYMAVKYPIGDKNTENKDDLKKYQNGSSENTNDSHIQNEIEKHIDSFRMKVLGILENCIQSPKIKKILEENKNSSQNANNNNNNNNNNTNKRRKISNDEEDIENNEPKKKRGRPSSKRKLNYDNVPIINEEDMDKINKMSKEEVLDFIHKIKEEWMNNQTFTKDHKNNKDTQQKNDVLIEELINNAYKVTFGSFTGSRVIVRISPWPFIDIQILNTYGTNFMPKYYTHKKKNSKTRAMNKKNGNGGEDGFNLKNGNLSNNNNNKNGHNHYHHHHENLDEEDEEADNSEDDDMDSEDEEGDEKNSSKYDDDDENDDENDKNNMFSKIDNSKEINFKHSHMTVDEKMNTMKMQLLRTYTNGFNIKEMIEILNSSEKEAINDTTPLDLYSMESEMHEEIIKYEELNNKLVENDSIACIEKNDHNHPNGMNEVNSTRKINKSNDLKIKKINQESSSSSSSLVNYGRMTTTTSISVSNNNYHNHHHHHHQITNTVTLQHPPTKNIQLQVRNNNNNNNNNNKKKKYNNKNSSNSKKNGLYSFSSRRRRRMKKKDNQLKVEHKLLLITGPFTLDSALHFLFKVDNESRGPIPRAGKFLKLSMAYKKKIYMDIDKMFGERYNGILSLEKTSEEGSSCYYDIKINPIHLFKELE